MSPVDWTKASMLEPSRRMAAAGGMLKMSSSSSSSNCCSVRGDDSGGDDVCVCSSVEKWTSLAGSGGGGGSSGGEGDFDLGGVECCSGDVVEVAAVTPSASGRGDMSPSILDASVRAARF